MQTYPTVATMPNRKNRKAARKHIFAENSDWYSARRRERKATKKKAKEGLNGNE